MGVTMPNGLSPFPTPLLTKEGKVLETNKTGLAPLLSYAISGEHYGVNPYQFLSERRNNHEQ